MPGSRSGATVHTRGMSGRIVGPSLVPRCNDRFRAVLVRLGLAMTLTLLFLRAPVLARDQVLMLDLQVNGYWVGKIGEFLLRDGELLARSDELSALGFRLPGDLELKADALVNVSKLPRLTLQLNQANQTLSVTAPHERLAPVLLDVGDKTKRRGAVESATGATLNYDVNATSVAGRMGASGLLDLRAFSQWGVLSSGVLAYAGARDTGTASLVRLDSTYTFSDPMKLRRYRVGDFINDGLAWTRPVRLGGVQLASDFRLRPDLITFPLPSISGSAAVPSTLDVLVNGNRFLSRSVGAGPFEIPQLPVVTGAGTISMTLTDALGRPVVTTLPFYASLALLAPGLQTFSAQAGAVRRNWGLRSNDYGKLAASASFRRGLSPALTLEASAEGARGTLMAGTGAVVNLGNVAVLNVAGAVSKGSVGKGALLSAGVQRTGPRFSVGASVTAASRKFRDIAAVNGDPRPRLILSANAGLSLGRFGSVGIAYADVRRDKAVTSTGLESGLFDLPRAQNGRILSASYSVQYRNLSFYATAFRDLSSNKSNAIQVGVTFPLGASSSAGASVSSGSGGTGGQVQAQRSPVETGDWGYQVYATGGSPAHQFAQAEYKSSWALLTAGADRIERRTALALRAAGSLSWLDGALFPANTISDSFAVVDTNGLAGVRVLHENRAVGRTNAAGRLLVPDLRAFDVNHIAIDATDVPVDVTINADTREVRPQDRSGIVVKFPVKVSHGALLRLVDDNGAPVPVGSSARLLPGGAAFPIGFDGEVYLEDLKRHNEIVVERAEGRRCHAAFDYRPLPGDIPTIGPVRCRTEKP
jgi:outer membrane usher protein